MDCDQNNPTPITDAMRELVWKRTRLTPLQRAIYFLVASNVFSTVGGLVGDLCREENDKDVEEVFRAVLELDAEGLANIPVTVRTE